MMDPPEEMDLKEVVVKTEMEEESDPLQDFEYPPLDVEVKEEEPQESVGGKKTRGNRKRKSADAKARQKKAYHRASRPPKPPKPPKPEKEKRPRERPKVPKKPKPPKPPKEVKEKPTKVPKETKPRKERAPRPHQPPEVKRAKARFYCLTRRLSLPPEKLDELREKHKLRARRRIQRLKETLGVEALRERRREYYHNMTPEVRKRFNQSVKRNLKKRRERMRAENPERYADELAKKREKQREMRERKSGRQIKARGPRQPNYLGKGWNLLSADEDKKRQYKALFDKRNSLKERLELGQKLLETGLTIEQLVTTDPALARKREELRVRARIYAARRSLRKKLEKEGVNPEEIEKRVEELSEKTYTNRRALREYKPKKVTKLYESAEIERLQKELDEVEERMEQLLMEGKKSCKKSQSSSSVPPQFSEQSSGKQNAPLSPSQTHDSSDMRIALHPNHAPLAFAPLRWTETEPTTPSSQDSCPPDGWEGEDSGSHDIADTPHHNSFDDYEEDELSPEQMPPDHTSTSFNEALVVSTSEHSTFGAQDLRISSPNQTSSSPSSSPHWNEEKPPTSSLDSYLPQAESWEGQDSSGDDNASISPSTPFSNPSGDEEDGQMCAETPPCHTIPSKEAPVTPPFSLTKSVTNSASFKISRAGRPPKAVNNPEICPECGRGFADRSNLRHHLNFYHNPHYSVQSKQCLLCQGHFSPPKAWYTHFCAAHPAQHEQYAELQGRRGFGQRLHRPQSKRRKEAICDECGGVFATRNSLHIHKNTYHNPSYDLENKWCRDCGKVVPLRKWYAHYTTLHKTVPQREGVVCEECGQIYSKQQLYHHQQRSHGAASAYETCPVCNRKIKGKYELAQHLRQLHPEHQDAGLRQCVCLRCPQSFLNAEMLGNHVRDQHPQSYFPCEFCGKVKFTRLALHAHYHRPRACKKIPPGEGIRRRRDWQKKNKTPFLVDLMHLPCELCGGKNQLQKLSLHYKTVHNVQEDGWKCGECGKEFRSRLYFASHLEEVHQKTLEELEGFVGKLNAEKREGMRESGKQGRGRGGKMKGGDSEEEDELSEMSSEETTDEEEEDEVPLMKRLKRGGRGRKKERRNVIVICAEDEPLAAVKFEV